MINFLKIIDWPIKKFLIFILTLQLLFLGSIGLDLIELRIPILRQLVSFIYLIFVPGLLTLRIFRLHNLSCIENLLYSVGLSFSFLMFMGFFMNEFYPLIGIKRPITIVPLMVTVSFTVLVLSSLCYLRDKDFSDPSSLRLYNVFSIPFIFLLSIPIWTVIGTYLMNFYNNNSLLLIVILLISSIIILVSLNLIPNDLYPLAIFTISFSLLFHSTLISMYVFGWDIQHEYYLANKVISNSFWQVGIYKSTNAMLSIVMFAPIYSILSNLNLTWVFKIVYPAIFSLMPLGLYLIFKKQTTDKIAFISTFFFISIFSFYTEMLQLARQQIAEYFFMLILLLIIQNKRDVNSLILLILFSFSLIVSHYGLSYMVAGSIICSFFILFFYKKYLNYSSVDNKITFSFMILFLVFLFSWYTYISSSSAFYDIIELLTNMIDNFLSDFLNPDKTQGLYLITKNATTPLHRVEKAMHLFTQFCISVGLVYILKKRFDKNLGFNIEYLSLCMVSFLILIAAILVPNFSNALNTSRIYQITLILLAPFCTVGGIIILRILFRRVPFFNKSRINVFTLRILSTFFFIFLLFNTGWIYQVVGDSPTSFSLNNSIDYPKFNENEVTGKEWLYSVNNVTNDNKYIYADVYRWVLFLSRFDDTKIKTLRNADQMSKNSYIYFSTLNILKNEVLIRHPKGVNFVLDYVSVNPYISSKNLIYNNGGAKIYN